MLGCFEEEVPFYIDPFSGGTLLSRGDVESFLWENIKPLLWTLFSASKIWKIGLLRVHLLQF